MFGIVQVFWGLDKKFVQCKYFFLINILFSYSKYIMMFDKWYEKEYFDFFCLCDCIKQFFFDSEEFDQVVQLVGKFVLFDFDKIILDMVIFIKEDFFQQNGYFKYDQFCFIWKMEWMMKFMMGFYDEV